MKRPRLLFLAMSLALAAAALFAGPVAAESVTFQNGTYGYYQFSDASGGPYGATCSYQTATYHLATIRVRPPLMHGNYSAKTKVSWRYKIFHSPSSGTPTWTRIYTASWQSDTANDAIPANGFTKRSWVAPHHPTGFFQVRLELNWWHHGVVEGVVKATYLYYAQKWNGNTAENDNYCLQDY